VTLLALLAALLLERLATRLLHLRQARWLEDYAGWVAARIAGSDGPGRLASCVALALLPVLPVAAVAVALAETAPGVVWLAFATLVLVFSLGPRDLAEEIGEYIDLETRGDTAGAARAASEIIEHDAAQRRELRAAAVEDAIFVQANNRIFGVLFWFVVLGPAGLGPAAAWLFRVSDLIRRQSIAATGTPGQAAGAGCPERLHFALAWAPARLLAFGYALAGSFEDARRSWRERYSGLPGRLLERNDWLLVHVGRAAISASFGIAADPVAPARAAMRLVQRALLFWVTVIALLSLAAWIA
jgi:membrane protein required for beta-lactamase induction